ncbi:MAG: flagellar biosynthesis protein FlhA [Treponema sp.]
MTLFKNQQEFIGKLSNVYLAAVAIFSVFLLLLPPMPAFFLDTLMVLNLMFSIMILLVILFEEDPTQFTVFPSMLLIVTVFGLGINISSTKSILTEGMRFNGKMINAFASFVIGSGNASSSSLVIGFVIFIVLIAVQAFVITKGASRISEVAARYALDFMNTRSMSIEAEISSGAITEAEGKEKKAALERSTNFYGAMDGASKFVSGNVKIGIFITIINIVAGLIIGSGINREPFAQALRAYTRFTIGDGLLSQIPSLLVSIATGLSVTRFVAVGDFANDIKKQFSQSANIFFITAATLLVMAVLPGFPHVILFVIAIIMALIGLRFVRVASNQKATLKSGVASETQSASVGGQGTKEATEPIIPLDHLSLEIGYTLVPLVTEKKGADLLKRIGAIRKEIALDLGLVAPNIRIMDNMSLNPDEYCFKIQGVEVARGNILVGSYLGINPGNVQEEIPGIRTKDPTFGLPAIWIAEENRAKAEMLGYTVVDPSSIIATHLTQVIKQYAHTILTRQMVQDILDSVKKKDAVVVDEVLRVSNLGVIQKIMQELLKEQVSIRNTSAILETISDIYPVCKNVSITVENVRQTLGRQIALQYADENKVLHVMKVDNEIIQKLIEGRVDLVTGPMVSITPDAQRAWIYSLQKSFMTFHQNGYMPVLLVQQEARILVKVSTEKEFPSLAVLGYPEIPTDVQVETLGVVKI